MVEVTKKTRIPGIDVKRFKALSMRKVKLTLPLLHLAQTDSVAKMCRQLPNAICTWEASF